MGASTYSTESVIEKQFYNLDSANVLLSTHKEVKLLEQYSEVFEQIEENVKNLPRENKQFTELKEKMEDISNRLDYVYKLYKQMLVAADGLHFILNCCSNSGKIEKTNSKSSDVEIEDIPFDFEGFSLSVFKCITLLESAFTYYLHISQNHLQGDSEFLAQNVSKCQEIKLGINKEDLAQVTSILMEKEEILYQIFCKNRSGAKQIFNALCRVGCVICITIHNNCDKHEHETSLMFSALSAVIYLCERLAQPLSVREAKVFPGQLIINTIFSLSEHKHKEIIEGSSICLRQLKSSPKLYSQIAVASTPIQQA